MVYVGMDVHSKTTTFCLYDPGAEPSRQYRYMTRPTTAKEIEAVLEPLGGDCRIAYEVGTQAQWVADKVRPLALDVQVANPSRIPWLFRSGKKNDRGDAKKLATLLYLDQLPTVHLPSQDVSAWRTMINYRRSLVTRRTMLKNQIRAILRTFVVRCPYRSCWTNQGRAWLRSLTFDEARTWMLRQLLDQVADSDKCIRELEVKLDAIAKTQPNVALLQTIPGIGPRTAEAIVAFTDRVDRFRNKKQYACYFGMTPTQNASGLVDHHGHISKRGPSVVRWVLIQATYQTVGRCPAFRQFFARIHRGKKDRRKKAIVATGRKLLTICYAMLRDQVPFDPNRVQWSPA